MAEPKIVDISEAAKHFSELLRKVEGGEEVIIARDGHPVARLSPINAPTKTRVPGSAKGLFTVPDNFNDPLPPEIQRYFEGEDDDSFW